jgi:hypothetical protein
MDPSAIVVWIPRKVKSPSGVRAMVVLSASSVQCSASPFDSATQYELPLLLCTLHSAAENASRVVPTPCTDRPRTLSHLVETLLPRDATADPLSYPGIFFCNFASEAPRTNTPSTSDPMVLFSTVTPHVTAEFLSVTIGNPVPAAREFFCRSQRRSAPEYELTSGSHHILHKLHKLHKLHRLHKLPTGDAPVGFQLPR